MVCYRHQPPKFYTNDGSAYTSKEINKEINKIKTICQPTTEV